MKDVFPADQDHGWTDEEQDENGYVVVYLRCTKSIAMGRTCNAPAHEVRVDYSLSRYRRHR